MPKTTKVKKKVKKVKSKSVSKQKPKVVSKQKPKVVSKPKDINKDWFVVVEICNVNNYAQRLVYFKHGIAVVGNSDGQRKLLLFF